MAVPYSLLFLALLAAYMVYSVWARLDSRYVIGGALVLLIAGAVADAAGSVPVANTVAQYVLFLLAAGVVLLLVDYLRDRPDRVAGRPALGGAGSSMRPSAQAVQDPDRPPDHALDRPE
ncbi:MAG: hypothetical protein WBG19_06220 [Thermoplasmata archaeon]